MSTLLLINQASNISFKIFMFDCKNSLMILSPGYDFQLQLVVKLKIGRYGVVGNVELPLIYHCSQVHYYPKW